MKSVKRSIIFSILLTSLIANSCSKDKSEKNRRNPGEAGGVVSLTFEGVNYTFNVETLYIDNLVDANPPSKRKIEGAADAGQYGVAFKFNVYDTGSYSVENDNIPLELNILSKAGGSANVIFGTPTREIDPVSGAPFFPVFNLNISKWEGHQHREKDSKGRTLFERLENFEANFEITYRVPQFDPCIEEYKSVTSGSMRMSLK